MTITLMHTDLNLPLFKRGKVRDVYDLGDALLIVATDRVSAFDVVFPNGVPDKGRVLNLLAAYWFRQTEPVVRNHLRSVEEADLAAAAGEAARPLAGRAMLAERLQVLPVECVVRGYLAGSGWAEYKQTGAVCGVKLPGGLVESSRLPEPIFTPARKVDDGHDVNITLADVAGMLGRELAEALSAVSLRLYAAGARRALEAGLILADAKFEFAVGADGLVLIDEVFTPDSSRFWPAAAYSPGRSQDSYDKQFLRDWVEATGWDKQPPAPVIPVDVVEKTRERYLEAYRLLTGQRLPLA
ncbi:MAG: phosphoribosylaminoimidazolesuccinocarboxamide synthase [Bacillota bacterium]